jgi:hypothetical protein
MQLYYFPEVEFRSEKKAYTPQENQRKILLYYNLGLNP